MIRWAPWEIAVLQPRTASVGIPAWLRTAPPRRAVLIALGVAVVVAEAVALRPVLFDREAVVEGVEVQRAIQGIEVVLALIGGSFAACGLIAWQRRPDSYSGLLMLATAVSFLAPPVLGQIDDAFASTCGSCSSTPGSSRTSR